MLIKHAQKEALKQINTTFKLSEIGYGQGFHEGQMQERKYWKDKIKAKIEIIKEEKENCKDSIEEKYLLREIYVLQLLLEKGGNKNDKK